MFLRDLTEGSAVVLHVHVGDGSPVQHFEVSGPLQFVPVSPAIWVDRVCFDWSTEVEPVTGGAPGNFRVKPRLAEADRPDGLCIATLAGV